MGNYLHLESSMGYSERAVGILQSILEVNMNSHYLDWNCSHNWRETWKESFQDFWDSEAPRIGDCFPDTGWITWANQDLYLDEKEFDGGLKRKKKKRLRASDFFDHDESGGK